MPLLESIDAYFGREVRPYVPDAWVNTDVRDPKGQQVGKVGYEINFNRYFFVYTPPRPLDDIQKELRTLETEIVALLGQITGSRNAGPCD